MTDSLKKQLLQDGFCIVENVLDRKMLDQLTRVTMQLVTAQSSEDAAAQRSTGSMIDVFEDPFFVELITYHGALEALAELGYPEPKFSGGYVISKPPHSPPLFWHHDWAAWGDPDCFGEIPQQLFLMYYLTDTFPENGCLRVIPGSHVHDNPLHVLLEEAHSRELSEARNLENPAFSSRPDEINVQVKAGDIVIGDSRLLHATHANDSDYQRTVITLWYHPDMAALSESVQGYIAGLSPRTPDHWPSAVKALIEPLFPIYAGHRMPQPRSRKRPMRGQ